MCPLSGWHTPQHPTAGMAAPTFSIKSKFDGAVVFITGATGYIGSVVLEQLLRTTNVGKVYLLMRPRRGEDIQQRLNKLLQGALFHKVRDGTKLLKKVKVMAGDIIMPGLGLSAADKAVLLSSVDFIVHCAADIRLEADIQETLTANFEGTRTVLELAAAAGHLKAIVHVSSAFVNMNQPRSTIVDEQVYPLKYGHQVVDVEELTREFMSLPKRDANHRAETLMRLWKFPNTYTMGKHMSEQLVTRYQAKQQLPVAIVRPSLVSAIAGEPYPGYVGNWAGPIGAGAAMAIGMFDCLESVASRPMGIWDIVPADMVASIILAAAAAVCTGVGATISRATKSGSIAGTAADSAVVLGQPHPFSQAPRLHDADASAAQYVSPDVAATIKLAATDHHSAADIPHKANAAKSFAGGRALSARSDDTAMSASDSSPDTNSDVCSISSSGTGFMGSPKLLGTSYKTPRGTANLTYQMLESVTVSCQGCSHSCDSDIHDDLATSDDGDDHTRLPLLIIHAATSSTYPLTLMEGWNYNLDFFDAHPQPFRICWGDPPIMTSDFVPTDANVMACRRRIWWKVWAISTILKLMGKEKEARKLVIGYETFCVHNNSKTDRDLKFSTHALVALEAALDPSETVDYLLVWRPVTNRAHHSISSSSSSSKDSSQEPIKPQKRGSKKKASAAAKAAARAAAKAPLGRSEAALAPVAGDVVWRRYIHTQMAGIYRMLYGVEVDQHKVMGSAAAAAAQEGTALTAQSFIEHDFRRIK